MMFGWTTRRFVAISRLGRTSDQLVDGEATGCKVSVSLGYVGLGTSGYHNQLTDTPSSVAIRCRFFADSLFPVVGFV